MRFPKFSSVTLPFTVLAMGLALAACNKDDDAPATPADPGGGGGGGGNSTPSTTPNFDGADASLWAIRAFSTQTTPIGEIDVELGTAVAAFSNDGFASMVGVGTVELNSNALTPATNQAYSFQPSATQPTGMDLSSGTLAWEVQGGNGFDGFTYTYSNMAFPNPVSGVITSGTTVVRADGYTLSIASVSNADSVLFMVGDVVRTLPGGATSCTFTADELAGLSAGTNLMQVAPYAYKLQVLGGKNVYFGKEMVRSKSVTIQ